MEMGPLNIIPLTAGMTLNLGSRGSREMLQKESVLLPGCIAVCSPDTLLQLTGVLQCLSPKVQAALPASGS